MRITCPSCGTQYDVDENDIAFSGQEVQCSECQEIWIQKRDGSVLSPEPESDTATDTDTETRIDTDKPETGEPQESKTGDVPDEGPETEDTTAETAGKGPDDTGNAEDEAEDTAETDFPPIQEAPVVVDEPLEEQAIDGAEKPWESDEAPQETTAAEEDTGILDEIENAAEIIEITEGETSEEAAPVGEDQPYGDDVATDSNEESAASDDGEARPDDDSDVKLRLVSDIETDTGESDANEEDEFDEDELLKTFRTQIEIEDELEANPPPVDENVTPLPEDLIGRRARGPNIDAVKDSIRSGDTGGPAVTPQNRFRRGFILPLVLLALVSALYVFSGPLGTMVPALAPVLKAVVAIVDAIRNAAAGIGNLVLGLINRS